MEWLDANPLLFDAHSLDVELEVVEVVVGLQQLAILELEVRELEGARRGLNAG